MNTVQTLTLSALLCGALAGCSDGSGPSADVARPATSQLPAAAVNARGVDYPNTHWRGPGLGTRGGGRRTVTIKHPKKVTPPPAPLAASAAVPGPSATPSATPGSSATPSSSADTLQLRE